MKTKLPSIASVRSALVREWAYLRRSFVRSELVGCGEDFAGTDIRLQVYPSGAWSIHSGSADYDQDHKGYWGASCLSYDRQNLTDLARDLINQCAESIATESE